MNVVIFLIILIRDGTLNEEIFITNIKNGTKKFFIKR